MKMDAGEKELARLRRARGMEICSWRQARANALRQGHVPQGRRLNIRLSSKDLEAIQKRALAEGLPHQS